MTSPVSSVEPSRVAEARLPYLEERSPCLDKLDRLPWAHGYAFECFGTRFGVRTNTPSVLMQLEPHLPPHMRWIPNGPVEVLYSLLSPAASGATNVRRYQLLYGNTALMARSLDLAPILDELEKHAQQWTASFNHRWLFVHAGVVGWRGRALLVPGRSESGKSTLVDALVRAGATYYSDEYAVLDDTGRVHPFARPIRLRVPGSDGKPVARRVHVAAECVGAGLLTVGAVLVTRYRAGTRFRPRRIGTGRGVLSLLSHTVSARQQPARALEILSRAVEGADLLGGTRGDADEAARLLLARMETSDVP